MTLSTEYIQNFQVDLPPLVLTRVLECGEECGHHLVPVFMSEVIIDNSETSSRNAAVMISVITRQGDTSVEDEAFQNIENSAKVIF